VLFKAFPEADAYSGIKREVEQKHRRSIEAKLPFKVHFNELGKHELLVAFRGRRPAGLVYCRTEEAEWGLVEIAWHMTLDRRIVGFQFLRGRSRYLKTLEHGPLATDLGGSNFDQVAQLVAAHDKLDHSGRADSLVSIERTTLRSAAKVLAILETVWQDQIETLSDQATGFDLFPTSARFTRRSTTFGMDSTGTKQSISTKILYAYDIHNMFLGCVAWTRGKTGIEQHAFRWAIDRNMHVLATQPTESVRNVALRKACSQLQGRSLNVPPNENMPLSPLATVLGTVIADLAKADSR